MKKQRPVQRIWGAGQGRTRQARHGGDFGGRRRGVRHGAVFCGGALAGYLLRTALYNGALGLSHKATFNILKTIRQMLLAKLPRLPLGTVMDTSSGKLKQTIVDQVDSMETTLAHLFPEMTANITAPVLTLIYLFALDWRLALLSLAVFPIAFVFMMTVMGGYWSKGRTLKRILWCDDDAVKPYFIAAGKALTCANLRRQLGDSLVDAPFPPLPEDLQRRTYFAFGSAEDHYKYRDAVKRAYPYGHYPVFAGYDHMQYQIRDSAGFAAMLSSIMENDRMPELPFVRK